MACPPETIDPPIYDQDYGKGLYILTENGVNFYNPKDSTLTENIFQKVRLKKCPPTLIAGASVFLVCLNIRKKIFSYV